MGVSFGVSGGKEVDAALTELEAKTAKKYIRAAGKAAMRPVLAAAKADAPKRTGYLASKIKLFSRTKQGVITTLVGLIAKQFTGREFYAQFQERGWFLGKRTAALKRIAKKAGAGAVEAYAEASIKMGRKHIEGKHFVQNAFDSRVESVIGTYKSTLVKLIEEGAAEIGSKTKPK